MKKVYILILTAFVGVVAIIVMSPKAYAYEYDNTIQYEGLTYSSVILDKYFYVSNDDYDKDWFETRFIYDNITKLNYMNDGLYNFNLYEVYLNINLIDVSTNMGIFYSYDNDINYTEVIIDIIDIRYNYPIKVIYKSETSSWGFHEPNNYGINYIYGFKLTYSQVGGDGSNYGNYKLSYYTNLNGPARDIDDIGDYRSKFGFAINTQNEGDWSNGWDEGNRKGFDDGFYEGSKQGENKGLIEGEAIGLNKGLKAGNEQGYNKGLKEGEAIGYNKGISEDYTTGGLGLLLSSGFTALGTLLAIELIPNISIGALVSIPIVFGVIMFIIGRKKE